MKPLVRKFRWTDIELQRTSEPITFPTLLEIYVGYDDREGVDQFQIEVVTLHYLRDVLAREHVMLGLHLALVDDFSAPAVESYLRAQIEGLEADSWEELVNKIGRIVMWESQDYGFSQSRRPKDG